MYLHYYETNYEVINEIVLFLKFEELILQTLLLHVVESRDKGYSIQGML